MKDKNSRLENEIFDPKILMESATDGLYEEKVQNAIKGSDNLAQTALE